MSICRFGHGCDVYMYQGSNQSTGLPEVRCCHCKLLPEVQSKDYDPGWTVAETVLTDWNQVVAHLHAHRNAGHVFPSGLFDYCRPEDPNDPRIKSYEEMEIESRGETEAKS